MIFANMNLDRQLGDVTTSAKGTKSAPLTDGNGSLNFQLATPDKPLHAPFGASADNDPQATRKTICLRVHAELEASLFNADAYMSDYIAKHSNRLFKCKQMTYKPLLQLKEDYPALFRAKINTNGSKACMFWGRLNSEDAAHHKISENVGWFQRCASEAFGQWGRNVGSRSMSQICCATRAMASARFAGNCNPCLN